MSRYFFLLFSVLVMSTSVADSFEQQIVTDDSQLQKCNQTEVSVWSFIDVASAALYSADCSKLPELADSIQISFIYHRDFKAADFVEASETLLKRNLSDDKFQQIEPALNHFNQSYQPVQDGERYDVRLSPSGLYLLKNGEQISHSRSQLLGKHYYQIWFGDKPFNKKMKQALLKPVS